MKHGPIIPSVYFNRVASRLEELKTPGNLPRKEEE